MRKRLQLLFILLISTINIVAQERNFGDTANPVPSAASFSSFASTPVSLVTGVPDVSIPFFTLPTVNKNISIPIGLRYHVYNAVIDMPSTEVGLGWTLFKGGVISRNIAGGEVDEKYDDATKPNYKMNKFFNVYTYSLPGISGKFKIDRDTINNTFSLNNLSGNNIKIEYTRTSNTATLIVASFKITDEKGFKYLFNDYSVALRDNHYNYRSAFYLTKILDENDIEVVNFTYQKKTKYSGSLLTYQNCLLSKISSNFGSIDIENVYDSYWENNGYSDPYSIQSISLFDHSNRLQSKYKLEYSTIDGDGITQFGNIRRGLYYIRKLDKDQKMIESRSFKYNQTVSPGPYQPICSSTIFYSPRNITYGMLTEMSLPEGGYISYNYEPNEIFTNYNITGNEYADADNYSYKYPAIQRFVGNNINFDTNQGRIYTFQVDTNRAVFLALDAEFYYRDQYHLTIHDDPETYDYKITYKLKKNGVLITGVQNCNYSFIRYDLSPGTYTVELTGFGYGSVGKTIIETDPPPYIFRKASVVSSGARIKEIKYYDTSYNLKKSMNYEYNTFDDALSSSGTSLYPPQMTDATILYKNVKEIYGTTANNLGYSQYYFKTPADYTTGSAQNLDLFYSFYNITSQGVLYKKETYNTQNQIQTQDIVDQTMEELIGVQEQTAGMGKSKAGWVKSAKSTSKTFFNNGTSLENLSEVTYSQANYEPVYTKETAADGTITEKTIKYPTDVPNAKLLAAHVLSVPLETEIKVNGNLVSKAETRYDNASTLFPTSVTSYEMKDQTAQTKVIFSSYDSYGNLIESKTPQGIPTTTIYGYNHSRPIAKIEGASYTDIGSLSVVQNAVTASNTATPENESALQTALENLRVSSDLSDHIITTYTWDVLTGMTGTTSANGSKERYEYDRAGRLWKVWDKEGKLLKEYKYNYKQ